jgi:uncharacterized Zn finger protein
MAARRKTTVEERIAEYVDSPLVTQRVRHGKQLSARIADNYGVYRTQAGRSKKVTGDCTCPSELWPCKHIHALRATWEANPESFFDLDRWLKELSEQSKASLVAAIGKIVVQSPECLSVFGVPGFEEVGEDEEEYYG